MASYTYARPKQETRGGSRELGDLWRAQQIHSVLPKNELNGEGGWDLYVNNHVKVLMYL